MEDAQAADCRVYELVIGTKWFNTAFLWVPFNSRSSKTAMDSPRFSPWVVPRNGSL
jgi:hypothetical protein